MIPPASIAELLEMGVLYNSIDVPDTEQLYQEPLTGRTGSMVMMPAQIPPPAELRLFCSHDRCADVMDWYLADEGEPYEARKDIANGYTLLEYRCRHTPKEKVVFVLFRVNFKQNGSHIELVGRQPRSTAYLPDELRRALGEIDQDRYSKALDSRARGLGVAAVVYMRRVIEAEMDRIIDMIVELLSDEKDAELRQSLINLKGARQFSEKAKVADALLPLSFFPGHQNPFTQLHDLTSEGVHNLDDVESAEAFDNCRELFEMLFQKLLRDRQTQRLYRERLASVKRKSQN